MLVIQSLVRVRNLGFLGSRLSVERLQSNNMTFRMGSSQFRASTLEKLLAKIGNVTLSVIRQNRNPLTRNDSTSPSFFRTYTHESNKVVTLMEQRWGWALCYSGKLMGN